MNVFMRTVRRGANRGCSAAGEDQLKSECEGLTHFLVSGSEQKCPCFAVGVTPLTEVAES